MNSVLRWSLIFVGLFLLLFGWRCLNYTKHSGWEWHTQFAVQHNLPHPSETIRLAGIGTLIAGAAMLGYAGGRVQGGRKPRNPASRSDPSARAKS